MVARRSNHPRHDHRALRRRTRAHRRIRRCRGSPVRRRDSRGWPRSGSTPRTWRARTAFARGSSGRDRRHAGRAVWVKVRHVVPDRGFAGSLPFSTYLTQVWGDTSCIDAGDGFRLTRGWTIAWCGWQSDVRRDSGGMGFAAPEATRGGRPIEGQLRIEMRADTGFADHPLSDSSLMFTFENYPTADVVDQTAVL